MKKTILTLLTFTMFNACNQSKDETQKQQPKFKIGLIEITTFKLNKGVSSNDFIKSAEQMQKDFLVNQGGFIKRTLTNSCDTLWTDIVYWENQEMQTAAMKLGEKTPQVIPFMEKIDFSSVKITLAKPIISTE